MKTLIAVPCFDTVHTDFAKSLIDLIKPPGTSYTFIKNTLIYDSRNTVAASAIEAGFDRIFWMDSDMTFPPDALVRLSQAMDEGRQMVSGLYFTRRFPNIRPVLFSKMTYTEHDGVADSEAEFWYDYPDGITECEAVGFGCCLTSVDLIRRVAEKFGSPFTPFSIMGEDMAFCLRVRLLGEKIYCDTRIKCGHIGAVEINEDLFKAIRGNAVGAEIQKTGRA